MIQTVSGAGVIYHLNMEINGSLTHTSLEIQAVATVTMHRISVYVCVCRGGQLDATGDK